jgi:hypothetical protein
MRREMPQDKEGLFDKFRRAQRFGKDKPSSVKGIQNFAKKEAERKKKAQAGKVTGKVMKDSRWFKNIKPDVHLAKVTK